MNGTDTIGMDEHTGGGEMKTPLKVTVSIDLMTRLTKGHRRYEVMRKLNVRQFAELYKRSINGENFDAMVDELVERQ